MGYLPLHICLLVFSGILTVVCAQTSTVSTYFCHVDKTIKANLPAKLQKYSSIDQSEIQSAVTSSSPIWTECPPNQSGGIYEKDCTTLVLPLDRSNASLGTVNAFIRRFYVNQPTDDSLWLINGAIFPPNRSMLTISCPSMVSYHQG